MNFLQRGYLKSEKANDLIRLIDAVDAKSGNNPEMKDAGDAFGSMASNHRDQIKNLDAQLKKNPTLSREIQQLLEKDPAAFKKILPGMFKDPNNTQTLVKTALGAGAPDAAKQAKPVEPKPIEAVSDTGAAPDSGKDEYTVKKFPKDSAPATPLASTPAVESALTESGVEKKLAALSAAPGFNGLMDRIQKNPHLSDMLDLSGAEQDPKKMEEVVNGAYTAYQNNPKFFEEMNETIDKHPGAVSSIAMKFNGNPKEGIEAIAVYSGLSHNPLFGMLDKFTGGKMDQIFADFAGSSFGKMMIGFLGMMMGGLGDSKELIALGDTDQAKKVANAAGVGVVKGADGTPLGTETRNPSAPNLEDQNLKNKNTPNLSPPVGA